MRLLTGKGTESTRLIYVVEALDRAAKDPDIAGVEIVTGDLTRIGLASARTIGNAVERFKSVTGRPVYAWSESFSQGQYASNTLESAFPSIRREPSRVRRKFSPAMRLPRKTLRPRRVG